MAIFSNPLFATYTVYARNASSVPLSMARQASAAAGAAPSERAAGASVLQHGDWDHYQAITSPRRSTPCGCMSADIGMVSGQSGVTLWSHGAWAAGPCCAQPPQLSSELS